MAARADKLNLTVRLWGREQQLFRVHPGSCGATEFNPTLKGDARFSLLLDSSGNVIPALYTGSTLECALMETVFHDVAYVSGPKLLSKAKHVTGKVASILKPTCDLKLVDLSAIALRKLGVAPEDLTRTPASQYASTRIWASKIRERARDAHGLLWTSRQGDTAFAMVLFGDRVESGTLRSLGDTFSLVLPDGSPRCEVQALAARLDVLLI